MTPNTTTKTPAKVAKAKESAFQPKSPGAAPRAVHLWSRRELADLVNELTGKEYDPGYLMDIVYKSRRIKKLKPTLEKAIAILDARHKGGN